MRIAISGTYSVGKTLTTMAVSHLPGLPRSAAMTMWELLPISVPGKTLEEWTAAEVIMLIMRHHQERAVDELPLGKNFVSDDSSFSVTEYRFQNSSGCPRYTLCRNMRYGGRNGSADSRWPPPTPTP